MSRLRSFVAGLALVLWGCSATESGKVAAASDPTDLQRALRLAGLDAALASSIEYMAVVTPAVPKQGSTAMFAAAPKLWDPAAGQTGSMAITGNPTGNPYDGGHAGISFDAKTGFIYLALCQLEQPGGPWDFSYGDVATGSGQVQATSAELSMPSERIAASGRAYVTFASRQTGHKLLGCRLYGLKP